MLQPRSIFLRTVLYEFERFLMLKTTLTRFVLTTDRDVYIYDLTYFWIQLQCDPNYLHRSGLLLASTKESTGSRKSAHPSYRPLQNRPTSTIVKVLINDESDVLVIADDTKTVHIYSLSTCSRLASWYLCYVYYTVLTTFSMYYFLISEVSKKVNALAWDPHQKALFIGDKFGDVFRFAPAYSCHCIIA